MGAAPAAGRRGAGRDGPWLEQAFFARDTLTVARELIGTVLHATTGDGVVVAGRIVEAEAYLAADDPASHAAGGPTPRCAVMFGPPGRLYVYLIYGMHHCLNLVTETEGRAGAVLIRALEPVSGLAAMAERRRLALTPRTRRELCAGPGRLCRACGVDLAWNGLPVAADLPTDITAPGRLVLAPAAGSVGPVATTTRIGVRRGAEAPYRFVAAGSRYLSR